MNSSFINYKKEYKIPINGLRGNCNDGSPSPRKLHTTLNPFLSTHTSSPAY
jgi:hypothetical protein